MFYDERIELEKGRISRNCIIISVIVALLLGIPRFIFLNEYLSTLIYDPPKKFYLTVATEFAVAVSGAVCLALGFFCKLFEQSGEYRQAQKSRFYNKAVKIHIFISLMFFSVASPAMARFGIADISMGEISFSFIIPLFAYCAYAFKKSEIYFNYSIMEEEKYYFKVIWNIVKLAGCIFALTAVSLIANIVMGLGSGSSYTLEVMKELSSAYFYAFAIIALAYFAYSYLEKTSYDNESTLLSNAPFITLSIATAVSLFSVLYCIKMVLAPSHQSGIGLTGIFHHMCDVCIIAFLTYLNYEYQRERKSGLISAGTKMILTSIPTLQCVSSFYVIHLNSISSLMMNHATDADAREAYSLYYEKMYDAMGVCKDMTAVLQFIAVILIFRELIKRKHIPDSHYFIILFSIAVCAADLCLRPCFSGTLRGEYVLALFSNSVFTAILLYSSLITLAVRNKKLQERKNLYENK